MSLQSLNPQMIPNVESQKGYMNRDCEKGLRLRAYFEFALKEWGWFDAYERALELLPVGPGEVHAFQTEARQAQSELFKARHAYVEHMAECPLCSRRLVTPDAVAIIRERLKPPRVQ